MTTPEAALADRLAITDVLTRFGVAIDRRDWDMLARCFTDDAVLEYDVIGRSVSRDEFVANARDSNERYYTATLHALSNVLIEIDGNEARATSYGQSFHFRTGAVGGDSLNVMGTYDDRLTKGGDGWRISHRTYRGVWKIGNENLRDAEVR